MVVRQGRVRGRGDRDVGVDGEPEEAGQGGRDQHQWPGDDGPTAGPQDVQDDERGDEDRQEVVAEGEPDEEPADGEVDRRRVVRPDERAMKDEGGEEEVERVDLGDRRRSPHRPDDPGRQGRRDGDERVDLEADGDRHEGRESGRDEDGRQEVRPEGDRADGCQLGDRGDEDVGRVAGRVGDAEDVGDRLHLAPVAECDAGQERPDVDRESDDRGDRRREPGEAREAGRPAIDGLGVDPRIRAQARIARRAISPSICRSAST